MMTTVPMKHSSKSSCSVLVLGSSLLHHVISLSLTNVCAGNNIVKSIQAKVQVFKIRLRMNKISFDKLLSYIYDALLVNEILAKPRGDPIIPELCLYCTLRWLAGGSYLDICDIAGISKSSFYRIVWKTIKIIVLCDALAMKWPETDQEIEAAIEGFASISTQGVIHNCMGVADGYLLRIKVPPKKSVGNVRSYFSGHYHCYGVNIQAVADHHSRFIYLAMAAPV